MRTVTLIAALSLCACHRHPDCVPVVLTVRSTPEARVTLVKSGVPAELGTTPLSKANGACVGDTVRLTTGSSAYEESIQFGQIGEEKVIEKKF